MCFINNVIVLMYCQNCLFNLWDTILVAIIEIIREIFEDADEEKLFIKMINDETIFERIKLLVNPTQTYKKAA